MDGPWEHYLSEISQTEKDKYHYGITFLTVERLLGDMGEGRWKGKNFQN